MGCEAERAGQSHVALIPKARDRGSLALPYVGVRSKSAEPIAQPGLAGSLDHKQTVSDLPALSGELESSEDRLLKAAAGTQARLPTISCHL